MCALYGQVGRHNKRYHWGTANHLKIESGFQRTPTRPSIYHPYSALLSVSDTGALCAQLLCFVCTGVCSGLKPTQIVEDGAP